MKEAGVRFKRYPCVWLIASLLVAIPLVSMVAFGQDSDTSALYRTKGKVIAEGKNSTPVGDLKLKTYQIEEVQLARPANVNVNGRSMTVERAYRVTIKGGPFPVRDLPGIVWIDDTPLKYAQESEDLTEMTAITFDQSLLRDGAKISFSFGENKDSYTTLPEKLNLKGGK